jgi:glycosyltransferase involved in cell wall biosynthesis
VRQSLHLVHITPSFGLGGAQIRTVQLINHLGTRYRHTIVALDGDIRAAKGIANNGVLVDFANCSKTRNPLRGIVGLHSLLTREKPDLVLTYNWGSMDGVMAALACRLPVIHTEDGFSDGEAVRQKGRRIWCRRAILRRVRAVIAPSKTLAMIMRNVWKLPKPSIRHIPNGVDVNKFTPAAVEAYAGDAVVIGTVGQLRREKRQDRLVDACGALAAKYNIRLVLAGDGPERKALEQKVLTLNLGGRVDFPGHVLEPLNLYRQFNIFALSSSTEQMPLSVLEAMACGLPVLSTDVGDVKSMVSGANKEFITDWSGYQSALERLATGAELRRRLGAENRIRCAKIYSLSQMLAEYEKLYQICES